MQLTHPKCHEIKTNRSLDEHMKNEAEYPALYPSEYPAATVVTRTPTVWCDRQLPVLQQ